MNPIPTPHNAQPPQEPLCEICGMPATSHHMGGQEHTFSPESPQESPAETATPETDAFFTELMGATPVAGTRYLSLADFARRLERERDKLKAAFTPNGSLARENESLRAEVARLTTISDVHRETGISLAADVDSLRAQLKDMTDQFLAVSGQLGEARERYETAQYFKEDGDKAFNTLRDEHNALLERLKTELRVAQVSLKESTRKYQDGLDCVPFCELAAAMERLLAQLAQSDSPGAGKEGEGL